MRTALTWTSVPCVCASAADRRPGEHEEGRQREVLEAEELLGVDARRVQERAQPLVVLGVALGDEADLLHAGTRASQPRRSSSPSASAGCAPAAPIRRSTTKKGTALIPSAHGRALVLADVGRVAVAGEHVAHVVLGQADLEREARERLGVADALALGVVGAHQALLHRVLHAVGLGQLHEPVGVEGVAAAREVGAHVQAVGGRDLGELALAGERLVAAHAVLLREVRGAVDRALRPARADRARSCATSRRPRRGARRRPARPRSGACRRSTRGRRCQTRSRCPWLSALDASGRRAAPR